MSDAAREVGDPMTLRTGIDLGGTKIELLALDAAGREIFRKRVPTPQGDYEATVRAVADLVLEFESVSKKPGTVGIGIPGALSRVTGLVKNANSTCLIGHDLKGDLEKALDREIRIENDANCFALSESVDGAGKGAKVVFGVILGTGVGGGIVVSGEVLVGTNAIAGEWGHNPLPLPRAEDLPLPDCYCGRKGCIEAYLSGPALARDGENLERYEKRLARALAGVINVLDPDVIVLGGGISNIGRLYATVPVLWRPHVFSDQVATRLLPPVHGDSSGVRGAAWLWGGEYNDGGRSPMKKVLGLSVVLAMAPLAQAADIEAGKAKVAEVCAACHGANGVSVSDTIPNLAGQRAAYLEGQLKAFKDGMRKPQSAANPAAIMNAMAAQLSPAQIADVAAYFASLPGAAGAAKSALLANVVKSNLAFPEGYKGTFTKYHTINFPATKQVRYYYANPAAVQAAKAGKPLPDGSYLFTEVYAAKTDAEGKPVSGSDGFYVAEKPLFYTAMGTGAGWGNGIPDMLRNGNWNYAVFTLDKQPRPGVNQAECLGCHKPLDSVSYTFTLKELAGAK